jgi:hypothetical protein
MNHYTKQELESICHSSNNLFKSWATWVTTTGDRGMFSTNGIRYATQKEALEAGSELAGRWFAVTDFTAAPSEDEVNYKFIDGRAVSLEV